MGFWIQLAAWGLLFAAEEWTRPKSARPLPMIGEAGPEISKVSIRSNVPYAGMRTGSLRSSIVSACEYCDSKPLRDGRGRCKNCGSG